MACAGDEGLPLWVTARVSVEAGSVIGRDRYVGAAGAKIGMRGFGASGLIKDLMQAFGFTSGASGPSGGRSAPVRKPLFQS